MNRTELPVGRAVASAAVAKKPTWHATALALAVSAAFGITALDAHALALGRVNVQSGLGEPLRADIDIPDINADEAATLRVVVASPAAFRAAGLEYSPALANAQITLQRRADGRYFLRLASDRPVNDPFVDLILETNWSSGRIVRDYTMLFDPPNLRQGTAPLTAQVAPAATQAPTSRAPAVSSAVPGAGAAAAPRSAVTTPSPVRAAPEAQKSADSSGKRLTVHSGDTATRIAAANRPAGISLDQMLVAMLRTNPDAFVDGNINRLRTGAVLDVPSAERAGSVTASEATQTLVAQSRDFNEFRRRLAEGLPTARVAPADRQASGRLQAQVEDKKPGAGTPDKLTLSKGAVRGQGTDEQIARQREAQDSAARVAELNRNIAELGRLGGATTGSAATTAPQTTPAAANAPGIGASTAAGVTAPVAAAAGRANGQGTTPAPASTAAPSASSTTAATPALTPASTTAPGSPAAAPAVPGSAAAASAPAVADATSPASSSSATGSALPASAASQPSAAASVPTPATTAAPTPTVNASAAGKPATSVADSVLDNPVVPAGIGAALLALLGFGLFRIRQRRKANQVDSSFLESRLQPDSFFGASGGQRVDTAEGGSSMTGSSMVYSPSQLDAAGDVDPVAEADVYLAYGRDLQAEEILKEALRINPTRVAIHAKLLEIYAKRRDTKAFEQVAREARQVTQGTGSEWERIRELGQGLDGNNPLYRADGPLSATALRAPAAEVAPAAAAAGIAATATHVAPGVSRPVTPEGGDLDLDLDFSLNDDEPAAASRSAVASAIAPRAGNEQAASGLAAEAPLDMEFGSGRTDQRSPASVASQQDRADQDTIRESAELSATDNSLDFNPQRIEPSSPAVQASAVAAAPPVPDSGMIEFDLGALSLDLDTPPAAASSIGSHEPDTADAPLNTAGIPLVGDAGDSADDPLVTKLALAEEFNAIGDPDGARSLAEEVLAEASGDLRSRAQRLLAEIG